MIIYREILDHDGWMSEWSKLEQEDRRVAQKMQQLYYWDFRLFGYTKP